MSFANFIAGMGYALKPFKNIFDGGVAFEASANTAITQSSNLASLRERDKVSQALTGAHIKIADYVPEARSAVEPWLRYRLAELGLPYVTFAQAREEIVRDFIAQDYKVAARAVVYGANPADNVVGIHRRLTKNKFGETIETGMHTEAGITITVTGTEASGEELGVTEVSYAGAPNDDQSNFNAKGSGASVTGIQLIGPEAANSLAQNPTFGGLASPSDGDAIGSTDIDDWTQDVSGIGSVTVKARPNVVWRSQEYGVGIGGTSGSWIAAQPLTEWDLDEGVPVAYMLPAYQSGAGVVFDITAAMGAQSDAWDEGDTTNGAWVPLVCTLDENLFPENFDTTDSEFNLQVDMDAASSGEIVLGGLYSAKMFQLQEGGEWHIAWEREGQPNLHAQVAFGADTQSAAGPEQDLWCRMDEAGPSLPITGTNTWALP